MRKISSSRDLSDIKAVFENIGVFLSPEMLKELWEEASRRHPEGKVIIIMAT